MSWNDKLKSVFHKKSRIEQVPKSEPVNANTTDEEKRERVAILTPDEFKVYKWLRENYTLKWTAETLTITLSETRDHATSMYQKLGVKDQRGLIRLYGFLDMERSEVVVPSIFDNE